ncbi:hypothetical protein EVAR_35466_1 [Eumeta japonica]|uniref:Uncharacterized protein n=1 Tax=Eumeta variegata TaxID=151549 RepID=A0A4C1XPL7_EUMVA|nr:hypothetical protein EVAR_35466_1 [Eumeta japonica]
MRSLRGICGSEICRNSNVKERCGVNENVDLRLDTLRWPGTNVGPPTAVVTDAVTTSERRRIDVIDEVRCKSTHVRNALNALCMHRVVTKNTNSIEKTNILIGRGVEGTSSSGLAVRGEQRSRRTSHATCGRENMEP